MSRLTLYLLKLFSIEAMALFAVAGFLLFLIQTLRLFDSVAARGQGLLTLIGQSLLGVPTLSMVFLYVCFGIGLGRALRGLQGSSELLVIHSTALVRLLIRAIAIYVAGAVVVLLLLAHVIEPMSQRVSTYWSQSIAAELVGHSLVPHKFTELVPGVTISISARGPGGEVRDFFADDRRSESARRTYIAKSALIGEDAQGYVLTLSDGVVQYRSGDREFSEFSFSRYDLALDRLTGSDTAAEQSTNTTTSIEMVAGALTSGTWPANLTQILTRRSSEAVRVIAICLLVASLALFPSGARRRGYIPIELVVLGAAFLERGLTSYGPRLGTGDLPSGSLVLLVIGVLVLLIRLRVLSRLRPASAS